MKIMKQCYLHQGGFVFTGICLFVCLTPTVLKKLLTDFYENFMKAWQLYKEQNSDQILEGGSNIILDE